MESDKVPFLLEDLISLLTDTMEWTAGSTPLTHKLQPLPDQALSVLSMFASNNKGLDMSDVHKERKAIGDWPHTSQVVIVNYPQYCRYRAVLKRLDGCKEDWLRSLMVCALGGITTLGEKTRVLFCRDSFEHPIIQEHELRQDHLAPNLRGRPKKKRANFRKYERDHIYSNESDDESNESVSSSTGSGSRSSPIKVKVLKEKVKLGRPQNGANSGSISAVLRSGTATPTMPAANGKKSMKRKRKKKKKNSTTEDDDKDEIDDIKIDISPLKPSHKHDLTKQEERFLKRLALFIREKQISVNRLPKLGFKEVDLYEFYNMTIKLGGYEQVTARKLWKQIYDALGGNATNTSAATCTRRHYEKMLMQFELHMKGVEVPVCKPAEKKAKKRKTSVNEETLPMKEEEGVLNGKEATKEKRFKKDISAIAKKKIKDLVSNESEKEKENHVEKEVLKEAVKEETDVDMKTENVGTLKQEIKPVISTKTEVMESKDAISQQTSASTNQKPTTQRPNILEQSKQVAAYSCIQTADVDTKPVGSVLTSREAAKPSSTKVACISTSDNTPLLSQRGIANGLDVSVSKQISSGAFQLGIGADGKVLIGNFVPRAHMGQHTLRPAGIETGNTFARVPPPAHSNKTGPRMPSTAAHAPTQSQMNLPRLLLVSPPPHLASQAPNQAANQSVCHAQTHQQNPNPPTITATNPDLSNKQLSDLNNVNQIKSERNLGNTSGNVQTPVIRAAHTKVPVKSLHNFHYKNLPANYMGHKVVQTTSGQKGKTKFLNPPPTRNQSVIFRIALYESPDVKVELLTKRQNTRKRGYPFGAGYLKEMNLRTPPPAHCNPILNPGSKNRIGFPPDAAIATIQARNQPVPAKRPKLVSELLQQQQQQSVEINPGPSSVPRNPFQDNQTNGGHALSSAMAQLIGIRPQIMSGGNIALGLRQPSSLPKPANNLCQQPPSMPLVQQNKMLPNPANQIHQQSQQIPTSQDAPLDLSSKPLRVMTNQLVRQLNKPSSPIVISPTSNDEPMDLCVKKNVNNQTHGHLSALPNSSRATGPAGNSARYPKVVQRPPSVIQATPSGCTLLTPSISAQYHRKSSIVSAPSVIQSTNFTHQLATPSIVQAPTIGSVLQVGGSVLQAGGSVSLNGNSGSLTNSILPNSNSVLSSIGGGSVLKSIGSSSTASAQPVVSSSLLQQAGGSLIQTGATSLLESSGSLIQQQPGATLIQPANANGSVLQTTPVISLSSVIRPPSTNDPSAAAAHTARITEQLSPAVASLLHPAFLKATSLSLSNAASLPATTSSPTTTQAGQPFMLPMSQLVSAGGVTPTLLPYMIPMQQVSQLLSTPLTPSQTPTSS